MNVRPPLLSNDVPRSAAASAPSGRWVRSWIDDSPVVVSVPGKSLPSSSPSSPPPSSNGNEVSAVVSVAPVLSEGQRSSVVSGGIQGRDEKSGGVVKGDGSCVKVGQPRSCVSVRSESGRDNKQQSSLIPAGTVDLRRLFSSDDPKDKLLVELLISTGAVDVNPILKALSVGGGSSDWSSTLKEKHLYGITTAFDAFGSGAGGVGLPQTVVFVGATAAGWFNAPAVGTGYNQRIGQEIICLRAKIRGCVTMTHDLSVATAEPWSVQTVTGPFIKFAVTREPVPLAASPTSFIAADANPPGSSVSSLVTLGVAFRAALTAVPVAVPNPLAEGLQELVAVHQVPQNKDKNMHYTGTEFYNLPTDVLQVAVQTYNFEFDVDMHGHRTRYLSGGTTPITNAYAVQLLGIDPSNANGVGTSYISAWTTLSVDFVFKDVTTS